MRLIDSILKGLLILVIRMYKLFFSPWFGGKCLFKESCSQAVLSSARSDGFFAALTVLRYRSTYCRNNFKRVTIANQNALLYPDGHVVYMHQLSDNVKIKLI